MVVFDLTKQEYQDGLKIISNPDKIVWIIVEGGDMFEGSVLDWANCFFSNPTIENIKEFCKHNSWTEVEIITEQEYKN